MVSTGAESATTALPQPAPRAARTTPPPQRGPHRARPEQVLTTRVGLQIPDVLSFEEWERAGRQLAGVVDSSAWWLGDWLTYGKDHYADRYQHGIRGAGLQYQTLRNYAWVARRFDMSRRHARLTFQHHAEVASLPAQEQDRWLSRAEESSWTTKQLRTALREARGPEPAKAPDGAGLRQLAVPRERYERWHQAAEHSGVAIDAWVLATLDSAAELVITAVTVTAPAAVTAPPAAVAPPAPADRSPAPADGPAPATP
ncbi:LmbU family transcriptional regulator [Streptomyces sp. NPDC059582]|uniref:LmbU family transcriptional regulator n=1 Tax=Streptomyces sp. NPDC059582 TaxID=3346875 RepID=UPI0036A7898C